MQTTPVPYLDYEISVTLQQSPRELLCKSVQRIFLGASQPIIMDLMHRIFLYRCREETLTSLRQGWERGHWLTHLLLICQEAWRLPGHCHPPTGTWPGPSRAPSPTWPGRAPGWSGPSPAHHSPQWSWEQEMGGRIPSRQKLRSVFWVKSRKMRKPSRLQSSFHSFWSHIWFTGHHTPPPSTLHPSSGPWSWT